MKRKHLASLDQRKRWLRFLESERIHSAVEFADNTKNRGDIGSTP